MTEISYLLEAASLGARADLKETIFDVLNVEDIKDLKWSTKIPEFVFKRHILALAKCLSVASNEQANLYGVDFAAPEDVDLDELPEPGMWKSLPLLLELADKLCAINNEQLNELEYFVEFVELLRNRQRAVEAHDKDELAALGGSYHMASWPDYLRYNPVLSDDELEQLFSHAATSMDSFSSFIDFIQMHLKHFADKEHLKQLFPLVKPMCAYMFGYQLIRPIRDLFCLAFDKLDADAFDELHAEASKIGLLPGERMKLHSGVTPATFLKKCEKEDASNMLAYFHFLMLFIPWGNVIEDCINAVLADKRCKFLFTTIAEAAPSIHDYLCEGTDDRAPALATLLAGACINDKTENSEALELFAALIDEGVVDINWIVMEVLVRGMTTGSLPFRKRSVSILLDLLTIGKIDMNFSDGDHPSAGTVSWSTLVCAVLDLYAPPTPTQAGQRYSLIKDLLVALDEHVASWATRHTVEPILRHLEKSESATKPWQHLVFNEFMAKTVAVHAKDQIPWTQIDAETEFTGVMDLIGAFPDMTGTQALFKLLPDFIEVNSPKSIVDEMQRWYDSNVALYKPTEARMQALSKNIAELRTKHGYDTAEPSEAGEDEEPPNKDPETTEAPRRFGSPVSFPSRSTSNARSRLTEARDGFKSYYGKGMAESDGDLPFSQSSSDVAGRHESLSPTSSGQRNDNYGVALDELRVTPRQETDFDRAWTSSTKHRSFSARRRRSAARRGVMSHSSSWIAGNLAGSSGSGFQRATINQGAIATQSTPNQRSSKRSRRRRPRGQKLQENSDATAAPPPAVSRRSVRKATGRRRRSGASRLKQATREAAGFSGSPPSTPAEPNPSEPRKSPYVPYRPRSQPSTPTRHSD
ncbi:unnamed protein product, partial [Mesorhabditis spiculigera]